MTVTLSYDDTLARVRITATGLAAASYALVERSTDQVRWTTVRGAAQWAVSAGSFSATLDDYEFTPGVVNYYRVRGVVSSASSFVASSTAVSAANGPLSPTAPAGIVAGDAVLILASTRNSGTGTVNTPASWSLIASSGNVALLGRIYDGVWSMPTVTFTNGAANEDTIAQAAAWRTVDIVPVTSQALLNVSAQNVAYPAVTVSQDNCTVVVAGWKQDDWTSVATLAGMTEVGEPTSIAGNDASQVWDYVQQTTAANIAAGSFTVTGGAAAISRGLTVVLPKQPYLNQQTNSITPGQTGAWLKSIGHPFLNMPVTLRPAPAMTYPGRGGVFDVVGRSDSPAVTDVRTGKGFELPVKTSTVAEAEALELLLADGGVLLLSIPDDGRRYPSGYVLVGDPVETPQGASTVSHWSLPCRTVAAPGATVVGSTATWQAILNHYATWADLIAAFPTWADVLAYVASPSDVITS